MKLTYWTIDREHTTSHFLTLKAIQPLFLGADDPNEDASSLTARIRWDGCSFIEDERPPQYHICHLWEERDRWNEAETIGRAFFGGKYSVSGTSDEWIAQFFEAFEAFEAFEGSVDEFCENMAIRYACGL